MLLDGYMLYRMFDSEVFPATGAWPPGAAAAEAIRAGDEGGRKAVILGVGVVVGIAGNWLIAPAVMSAFGVAFIGNIWALTMFGIGLLIRGYSRAVQPCCSPRFPDINKAYVPHGMMVGAGIVALIQVAMIIMRQGTMHGASRSTSHVDGDRLDLGIVPYVLIAMVIAAARRTGRTAFRRHARAVPDLRRVRRAGARTDRRPRGDAFRLVPGLRGRADHAGHRHPDRLPTCRTRFAGGFSAATGPAFADMGYDLKAGFMLRGYGSDPAFELDGRDSNFSQRCSRSLSPAWWC